MNVSFAFKTQIEICLIIKRVLYANAKSQTRKSMKVNVICTVYVVVQRAKRKTSVAILVLQFSYFNFHMNFSCKLTLYIVYVFSVWKLKINYILFFYSMCSTILRRVWNIYVAYATTPARCVVYIVYRQFIVGFQFI